MKMIIVLTIILIVNVFGDNLKEIKPINNIGFMKKPSKELTDKFPMCDSFLDVEWLNKEEKIGYSNYYIFGDGKKKTMWALVYLTEKTNAYTYDLYQYKIKGKLDKVFDAVRYGEVSNKNWYGPDIIYKGETIELWGRVREGYSLSNHTQTVCIAYPNNEKVWIVDAKSVRNSYSDEEIERIYEKFNKKVNKYVKTAFPNYWVIDVNFDATMDYIKGRGVKYQYNGKIYSPKRIVHLNTFEYIYPPENKNCHLPTDMGYFLTTDGSNYYIGNCNITKLIPKNSK